MGRLVMRGWPGRGCERLALALALALCSCGVTPQGDGSATGVDFGSDDGGCGRGLLVVASDYQSTNVGVIAWSGEVLAPSLVSSGVRPPGLTAAIGGDVVAPASAQSGEQVVLIDRYPAGVLTWVELGRGNVRAQLSVNQGFWANPHDYLELGARKAYVTRFGQNFDSGREALDAGGDLLVIDPVDAVAKGSVSLDSAMQDGPATLLPRPDRMLRIGERVWVLLGGYSADFLESAESRLVAVDPESDEILEVLPLAAHGCGQLALSPAGGRLAVACSGEYAGSADADPETAGLRVFEVSASGDLELEAELSAEELGGAPLGFGLDFSAEDELWFTTFGSLDAGGGSRPAEDRLLSVTLPSGRQGDPLLGAGVAPFTLGTIACSPACEICIVADAGTRGGVLHRFDSRRHALIDSIRLESDIGLPPRTLSKL